MSVGIEPQAATTLGVRLMTEPERILAEARRARAEAFAGGLRVARRWAVAQAREALHGLARLERRALQNLGVRRAH